MSENEVQSEEKINGIYYYDGKVIGSVEDLDVKNWFGKVTLFGLEGFSEYGMLDSQAIVKTLDGRTFKYEPIKNTEDSEEGFGFTNHE